MAFVHEIKFFNQDNRLFCALFEVPNRYSSEYWLKNVPAQELGIAKLPENVSLEHKYSIEALGIRPFFFYETVPQIEFVNSTAESAWGRGEQLPMNSFLS
jgi:hypothetical protein